MPESAWAGNHIPTITELAVDIIALDNDLTSYPGEQRNRRAQLNIITLLQQQNPLTEQQAIDYVSAMRDGKELQLLAIETALQKSNPHPATLQYIGGVKDWISGYLDFAKRHTRYQN